MSAGAFLRARLTGRRPVEKITAGDAARGDKSMLRHALVMLAAAAISDGAASAATVQATEPQSLVTALQAGGYMAQLGTTKSGDPMITSAAGGTKFQILFMNCTDHKACSTVEFYSGYHLDKPNSVDHINAFNQDKRFVRAYVDKENDPVVEMDVDLDKGGMSDALFIDNFEVWAAVLADYERHIGYRT